MDTFRSKVDFFKTISLLSNNDAALIKNVCSLLHKRQHFIRFTPYQKNLPVNVSVLINAPNCSFTHNKQSCLYKSYTITLFHFFTALMIHPALYVVAMLC